MIGNDTGALYRDAESRSAASNGAPPAPDSRVTVVMPCYNGEAFVGEAIASALAQSYTDIELIVVDDASTDGSAEIIWTAAERDRRLRPIFLRENGGPANARNAGFAAASGEWITLLDADDLYEPDRVERLLALARVTGADVVVDNQVVWDFPDGDAAIVAFDFLRGTLPVPISQDLFFGRSSLIGTMDPGYMKPMFRRAFLREAGIAYRPRYKIGEDFFLSAECFCHAASVYGTSYAGYIYRRRGDSISRSGGWGLRMLAAMSSEILAEYGSNLSPSAKAALKRRQRVLERYAKLADLRHGASQRGLRASLRTAMAHPDLLLLAPSILRKKFPRSAGL
ncbi:MAG: glycosyltransferase family 2 protein [Flavobacteriaceae bacterium]